MDKKSKKIDSAPYKGVRDFYPEDWSLQKYIFEKMKKSAESFGYLEYNASVIEPFELYEAKSGEEIVNEQTYTFLDRGERKVTLRPEMTPTVVRMVTAKKREFSLPLRLYSVQNFFRYEQPQKGRFREFWQLNADMFGSKDIEADVEIISLAYSLLKSFDAKDDSFEIRINDKEINNKLYDIYKLTSEQKKKISKIIDKKNKIETEKFKELLSEILEERTEEFFKTISSAEETLKQIGINTKESKNITSLLEKLKKNGITNIIFDPALVRGLDYYTGTVFEIYDTDKSNKRSIFGGGRYDNLSQIFDDEEIPAIGFGMGDASTIEFLNNHNLIPPYKSSTDLYICRAEESKTEEIQNTANQIRNKGLNVEIDLSHKKVGDQIKTAIKKKIKFVAIIGENEINSGQIIVKNLETGEESELSKIIKYIKDEKNSI